MSPTETSANCKRSNFLQRPKKSDPPPPTGNMQSRRPAGSLWQVHRPLHQAELPNQLPRGGQGCSHTLSIVHPLPHKRWCAAVTETATGVSAKCGDRRATKGWRWRTTRTAKPQSELKKFSKLSNVDSSPDTYLTLNTHWVLFCSFGGKQKQRLSTHKLSFCTWWWAE